MTTRILPLLTWRAALCDSSLAPPTRLVGLTLSLYMNERGGSAHPGAERLAHDTGLSERTVREHLSQLVAGGWLVLTEPGGLKGSRRRANEYEAVIPLQELHPYRSTPAAHDTRPLQETAPTPAPAAPHLSKNSPLNSRNASQEPINPAHYYKTGKQIHDENHAYTPAPPPPNLRPQPAEPPNP